MKDPHKVPRDLVADEKLTRVAKQQVYVPTTGGGGCFLGVSVVEAADTVTLEQGVQNMLAHLADWRTAPVWDVPKIQEATRTWFQYLEKKT